MAFCLKAPEGEDALDFDTFDDATIVGSGLDLEKNVRYRDVKNARYNLCFTYVAPRFKAF